MTARTGVQTDNPFFGKTVGLALGSGAARGMSYIGILEELEEDPLPRIC